MTCLLGLLGYSSDGGLETGGDLLFLKSLVESGLDALCILVELLYVTLVKEFLEKVDKFLQSFVGIINNFFNGSCFSFRSHNGRLLEAVFSFRSNRFQIFTHGVQLNIKLANIILF